MPLKTRLQLLVLWLSLSLVPMTFFLKSSLPSELDGLRLFTAGSLLMQLYPAPKWVAGLLECLMFKNHRV